MGRQGLERSVTAGEREPGKVIILAGKNYREFLVNYLTDASCQIEIPLQGLGIGQQLAWLKKASLDQG